MTCKFYAGMVFGNDLSLLSKPGYHKRVTGVWGFYKLRQHLLQEVMYQLFESRIRTKSGLEIFDKIFFGREVFAQVFPYLGLATICGIYDDCRIPLFCFLCLCGHDF